MATEVAPATTLHNVTQTFERLQSDLNGIQRELDQALSVWRATVSSEKQEFQSLLAGQQKHWTQLETEWETQRHAYEIRIAELEKHFKEQLLASEQNALRALNELDTAWQREKLQWSKPPAVAAPEADLAPLRAQVTALETEQGKLQRSLSERVMESLEKDTLIRRLQDDNARLRFRLTDSETKMKSHGHRIEDYVASLESQVGALEAYIRQHASPAPPSRTLRS